MPINGFLILNGMVTLLKKTLVRFAVKYPVFVKKNLPSLVLNVENHLVFALRSHRHLVINVGKVLVFAPKKLK
jgi:hypothetical protein